MCAEWTVWQARRVRCQAAVCVFVCVRWLLGLDSQLVECRWFSGVGEGRLSDTRDKQYNSSQEHDSRVKDPFPGTTRAILI